MSYSYARLAGPQPTVTDALGEQVCDLKRLVPNVRDFGAKGDGVTNDAAAIQAALNLTETVLVPAGVYCIASTLTLPADTILEILPGATIKWTGGAGGSMFTTSSAVPTRRTGVVGGGRIDPGSAGIVFDLHSPQESVFDVAEVMDGTATLVVMKLAADVAAGTGGVQSSMNAVFNRISIHAGICADVLDLIGTDVTKVVTLNEFPTIMGDDVRVKGIRHVQWCDSNDFGFVRLLLNADNAQGVIVNDSASPAANVGVYDNTYKLLAIDTFAGHVGRKALVLNWSQQTRVFAYFNDPAAEGGAIVDNNSQNHQIASNTATGFMEEVFKGTAFKAASGGGGFTVDATYALRAFLANGNPIFWARLDGVSAFLGALITNSIFASNGTDKLIDSVRKTGWTASTGAVNRAAFDTSTVTLAQLAGAVMALKADLTSHGLIGT